MTVRKMAVNAIKQQRVVLACAITVAVFLVGVGRAPWVPVAIGCLAALTLSMIRAMRAPRRD